MTRLRQGRGMTLVEILFAFAIVSTVLTLSYASALNAWRNAVSANQRTQAQYLAQQGIESIRAFRESDGFTWGGSSGFVSGLPATGDPDGFHIVMNVDGVSNASSYVCTGSTCEFAVESGAVGLNAVGTANDTSTGEALSIIDSTIYTLTIRPINYFVADDDSPHTGAIPTDGTVTSITFEATVTWTSADNVVSNVVASTIITRS